MKIFFKIVAIFMFLTSVFNACDGPNEVDDKNEFCSYINVENIDKNIPIVNEFLSGLSTILDFDKQLNELSTWLKSHPCIIDATVLGVAGGCSINNTMLSEILISFDENGIKKDLVLDVLQPKPFKAIGYHVYKEKNSPDRIHSIQLQEITDDSLIYVVYSTIAGGMVEYTVEYVEYDHHTIKVNILYSQTNEPATCIFLELSTVSIKKNAYQKAVISTFIKRCWMEEDCYNYLPIDSREISL